jgi:putative acetyltransferase
MSEVEIILYEDRYHADFKRLNLEWLDKYHLTESHDLMILDDPRGIVLNNGGIIYLARIGDEIVGTLGLMKEEEGVYELIKMGVTEKWQGKGISKILMDKCLETAREWKARKISLYTNSQLQRAIKMYEKYGFRHVKLENSPLATADVRMELTL